jgi:acetylxylan esterase
MSSLPLTCRRARSRARVFALLAVAAGVLAAAPARAGWQNDYAFGASLKGDLYTPSTLATPPAILVAIHMCTGHSTTVHGWFDQYADEYGFYIIAPDAGKQCFDASASRDGDKAAIVTMVNTLVTQKGADKNRVFAAGMSSGGCMTNTLLAVYPDIFAGGSAMPGFPAGGWPAGDITCTKCGSNPPSTDGKYWGDIARKVFQWNGTYPCSQQWVGGGDEYNFDGWLPAVAAQFQNLGNLGSGMSATGRSGWARTVYKDTAGNVRLETNLGPSDQKHDLETVKPPLYGDVVTFLGLDKPTGACGIGASAGTGGTSGGTGSGGATGSGGDSGGGGHAGGTGGGHAGTAGATGAGGNPTGSGGALGGGGRSGSGGNSGSGGAIAIGTGGHGAGTGGAATGGTSGGTGGVSSTGGSASGSGGAANPGDNGSSSGCSCATAGASRGGAVPLMLLGLGLLLASRRRRGR